MGCRQSKDEKLENAEDDAAQDAAAESTKIIVVFGATGAQGGSVVRALKGQDGFKIRAATRNPDGEKAKALAGEGIEVVKSDLDDLDSLKQLIEGAYGVFAVTPTGFDDESAEKEIQQGKNIVDAAKTCGVKHLVYSGLEDVQDAIGKRCHHFDSKAAVEKYIKEQDVPFTLVHLAFYYENLLGIVNTGYTRKEEEAFILDIPMGDNPLPMICVSEMGGCIKTILSDLEEYQGKTLGLASDNLKLEEYAAILTKQLDDKKVIAGTKSAEDYAKEDKPGAADVAVMFEYYTHESCVRDVELTRKLNADIPTFEQWVETNKVELQKVMD